MGSPRKIAVVGQGVMGLTCAARLLERGYALTLFSRDPFPETTSMAAGAYWWPHAAYPQEKVSRWAKASYDEYARLRDLPGSGVHFEEHLRFCVEADEGIHARDLLETWQAVDGKDYGVACREAFRVVVPVVDVPIFMPFLRDRLESEGVKFQRKALRSPGELFPAHEMVINCTGVGAHQFVGDQGVYPIRGQVVRVPSRPTLRASMRVTEKGDAFTLILPRSTDVVLGGTKQVGDWDLRPRDEETGRILARCSRLSPALGESEVLDVQVGLRPGRSEVRLELESLDGGRPVIHNYGHGGAGYTVAWGCASEVADLADRYFAGAGEAEPPSRCGNSGGGDGSAPRGDRQRSRNH